ncbi:hypothetical protein FISHEDRAFT_69548 [Fistulina hepatica ATCC 64428]|uniref:TECPR1-like DysF domain-containing protein n=1 Tax=Fistulina hepatica ATCC 64428 TaxID=1128425 RepID=A0A0D7APM5_9AGAR|nr:hypothetical protein FISHEDRAFT_69548 [Fistulina hepatica ATCC 64428]
MSSASQESASVARPRQSSHAVKPDDPQAVDAACQRCLQKSRFRLFEVLRSKFSKTGRHSAHGPHSLVTSDDTSPSPSLHLSDSRSLHDFQTIDIDAYASGNDGQTEDEYRWAILYENQRGITIFSTPYYSSLGLLPFDPSPFTLPGFSSKRSKQPRLSLQAYPLPDGNWRWVSKSWMVDMHADPGRQIQYDGFEYNWLFRKAHWRSQIGRFNAGGFVRRRRWIRLMMRPGITSDSTDPLDAGADVTTSPVRDWTTDVSLGVDTTMQRSSFTSSSIFPPPATSSLDTQSIERVWRGKDIEADWKRCRNLLSRMGRDGLRLDLWKQWLPPSCDTSPDNSFDPNIARPSIEYIETVLHKYVG